MPNDTNAKTAAVTKQDPYIAKMVIWVIMISALFTYLIIAYVAAYAPDHHKTITGPLIPLREILMALMVTSFFLGVALPKILPQLAKMTSDPHGYALFILRLLFYFAAALFGFLFTMLSFQIVYTLIGWALGFLGMMRLMPRRSSRA